MHDFNSTTRKWGGIPTPTEQPEKSARLKPSYSSSKVSFTDRLKHALLDIKAEWLDICEPKEMSESNIKRLKNAYRHPFEYISPLLYRRNTAMVEEHDKNLKASQIFCADEDDFNQLSKSQKE